MLLHINGSTKKVRKDIELASWYYAEKLMGKRLMAGLEININLKKDLLTEEGHEGTAIWDDDGYRPKEFTINLDTTVNFRNLLIYWFCSSSHFRCKFHICQMYQLVR